MARAIPFILGVDTGGTFTDFVLNEAGRLSTHKVLSTPDAPERAILKGIQALGLEEAVAAGALRIIHGTTVATNAALEAKGVPTAFITNRGFKDLLSIARQTRPALYHLQFPARKPPVPDELCLEISGRIDAKGNEIEGIEEAELQDLLAQLERLQPAAIAINLLFSFLNASHEQLLENVLRERLSWQPFICRSSSVLPEYREYERGIATWLNASLGPLVRNYLLRLKAGTRPSPLSIMQSTGGTISAEQAADKAVNLLLSGPAGGLAAAAHLSRQLKIPGLMTFDMGGTSTDAALLEEGAIQLGNEGKIGDFPVAVPMIDMHTIGAGGGSIAYLDDGGLLRVGPRSAGANPGPACYGLGGTQATVTDANLLLGRLQISAFMGGEMQLDLQAAESAIAKLAKKLALTYLQVSEGIVQIANEHMAQALRVISIQKGHDPKNFRLCCFGGAGGLHICALANTLGMSRALVPVHTGVLSALGMLLASAERNLSHSFQTLLDDCDEAQVQAEYASLREQALAELEAEQASTSQALTEYRADLRYYGQSSCLNLPWQGKTDTALAFHALHASRYGHRLHGRVELVNLRVQVSIKSQLDELPQIPRQDLAQPLDEFVLHGFTVPLKSYQREQLAPGQIVKGPALILEKNATTLIEPEWCARCDSFGNLYLDKFMPQAEDKA
jgi:N-methylhydantoinase A